MVRITTAPLKWSRPMGSRLVVGILLALVLICLAQAPIVIASDEVDGIDEAAFRAARAELQVELDEWMAIYGDKGPESGWIPTAPGGRRLSEVDLLRRLFATKKAIKRLESEYPTVTFTTKSPFTLMDKDEFSAFVRRSGAERGESVGRAVPASNTPNIASRLTDLDRLPARLDWSSHRCNGPVVDQGWECGSCWAFASVGLVDFARCFAHPAHRFTKFSEQQLISCDKVNYGCDGGFTKLGLDYILAEGLCTAAEFPYTSYTNNSGTCNTKCRRQPMRFVKETVSMASDAIIVNYLQRGPVNVPVSSENEVWKQYGSGIVPSCPTTDINHEVIAMGYDAESIKIKNEWGPRWGENGYIRLLRRPQGGNGTCEMHVEVNYISFTSSS